MNLLIMGLFTALNYEPTNRTYAIRIRSSWENRNISLVESSLYTIREYTFDDIWPGFGSGKIITDPMR